MLFFTLFSTGLVSFFTACYFKRAVYFFLAFFALIILNVEVLSLFHFINGASLCTLSFLEALFAVIFRKKAGLPEACDNFFKNLKGSFKEFVFEFKNALSDKSLLILSLFWVFLVVVSLFLSLFSPVNEPDAQGYHALRALFWAKDGFISHFETADVRAHVMPVNSEIFYTWILSLTNKDIGFGLFEFFSYFLLVISSFRIMKIYEIPFERRLWAIFVFSSCAGVISQISSTQTDLAVGALLVSSLLLIFEFKNEKKLHLLFFSSLAFALSLGVKSTAFMAGLPLIFWFIVLIKKDFLKFFAFLALNFVLFSSYNYILNFINYGCFLGSNSALIGHGFWGGLGAVYANFVRYVFQFFDFACFTIGFYLNPYLLSAQKFVIELFHLPVAIGQNVALNFTNISMTEQVLGFGVLGFLVLLPASLISFLDKKLRAFSILFWAQILVMSASIAYMVYSVRFLVAFAAFLIPVISITYFRKMNFYKFIIIFFSIFYMGYASLFLSQRPLKHLYPEIKKNGAKFVQDKMRDLDYKFYPSFNEALTMKNAVEPYCEANNRIGIFVSNGYMLYSSKYLEFTKNCRVESLNLLHFKRYDFSKYDILITQTKVPQKIEAINKKDIETPFISDDRVICHFIGIERKVNKENKDFENSNGNIMLSTNDVSHAVLAQCMVNDEYLKEIGFKKIKEVEALLPPLLKGREMETIKDFTVWGR